MKGSMASRGERLVRNLATHPADLFRYVRYLPVWKKMPVDVGLPWFSFGAIDYLDAWIKPTHDIFEFGSGGSSLFFGRRARSVLSVENNAGWHAIVQQKLQESRLSNVSCELHEFGDAEAHRYQSLSYFAALGNRAFDMIVVDGFCGFTTAEFGLLRPHSFELALASVRRPGGVIVVDDYWMFPDIHRQAPDAKLRVFESTGPCRYGVTSTAVFEF
jgi:hypothetical protein